MNYLFYLHKHIMRSLGRRPFCSSYPESKLTLVHVRCACKPSNNFFSTKQGTKFFKRKLNAWPLSGVYKLCTFA